MTTLHLMFRFHDYALVSLFFGGAGRASFFVPKKNASCVEKSQRIVPTAGFVQKLLILAKTVCYILQIVTCGLIYVYNCYDLW